MNQSGASWNLLLSSENSGCWHVLLTINYSCWVLCWRQWMREEVNTCASGARTIVSPHIHSTPLCACNSQHLALHYHHVLTLYYRCCINIIWCFNRLLLLMFSQSTVCSPFCFYFVIINSEIHSSCCHSVLAVYYHDMNCKFINQVF